MKEKSKEMPYKTISVYMPGYLITALEELVKKEGTNKSELIQRLVREYCEKHSTNSKTREMLSKHRLKDIVDSEKSLHHIHKKLLEELKED